MEPRWLIRFSERYPSFLAGCILLAITLICAHAQIYSVMW